MGTDGFCSGMPAKNLYCTNSKPDGYNREVENAFLYEKLADEVAGMVARGALKAGERLSSVRRFAEERGGGIATVLSTYLVLAGRRLVAARPKASRLVRAR